ncbi:MAG: ABC transporter permease [Gemmatimonadota bacterium]|nr:ABC transporter permease [Gemmatimonadota bacterium]
MRTASLVRVAAESILVNRLRTLLTMLGIIIGVGAVIVMVAVGEGAQSKIRDQIQGLGTNLLVITAGSSSTGGVSGGAGSFNRLQVEDAEKLEREGILLSGVSPMIMTYTQAIGGTGNWRTMINGVASNYPLIRDWSVEDGSFFQESDVRSMRKVAVIGRTVAENLFPDGDAVGQRIQLRSVPFEIIGVLAPKGQTAEGRDQDDVIVAPYTTVQTRLRGRSFIPQIIASTFSPGDIPAATEEIRGIMREAHDLAEWEEDDFTVRNQTELADAAQSTTEVMTILLASIAGISLLVGGIGIMNIMLVSVTERTKEIGVRMAVGARRGDVLTQFLVESVVMSLVGGLIGVGVGFAGSRLVADLTGWSTLIEPATIALALGFSASVGIFFGYYPARKAAGLDPIEALRWE